MGNEQSLNGEGPVKFDPNKGINQKRPKQSKKNLYQRVRVNKGIDRKHVNFGSALLKYDQKIFLNSDSDTDLFEKLQEQLNQKNKTQKIPSADIIWSYGGNEVFFISSYDNWAGQIKMEKKEDNSFALTFAFGEGTFQFKFLVDNKWSYSPDYETINDGKGNINNVIVVTNEDEEPNEEQKFEEDLLKKQIDLKMSLVANGYSQELPNFNDLATDTPLLPIHLTKNVINTKNYRTYVSRGGQSLTFFDRFQENYENRSEKYLPPPTHVTINHLSSLVQGDDMTTKKLGDSGRSISVIATTERIENKFITVVYYKPLVIE